MEGAASGTVVLQVSVIAGPAAGSIANQVWQAGNTRAPVGLLTPSPPPLTRPELSSRLFTLRSTDPAEINDQIRNIAAERTIDHLIIQGDEVRPLMALASLFARENEEPRPLVRLAHASTAIRAEGLLHLLLPSTSKRAPGLACLTVEELEFAGEVVLESGSNVRDIELARAVVATLNPRAVLLDASSNYSAALLDPGKPAFDFGAALDAAEWRRLVEEQPDPVSYSYGMGAMAYRARKPFHPERLWRLLHEDLHNVFRAKGFVWLATRTDFVGGLNLAGSELQCAPAGQWWATRDADTREREMPARTRAQWHEPFGDRRQAIALMTMNVEPNVIRAQLDACLLTPDEMAAGPERWQHLPDPFPSWSTHGHHHDCGHDHDECDHEHGPEPHDCCHH